jgi:hypothetical protein
MATLQIRSGSASGALDLVKMAKTISMQDLGYPNSITGSGATWSKSTGGHTVKIDVTGTGFNYGLGFLTGSALIQNMKIAFSEGGTLSLSNLALAGKLQDIQSLGSISNLFSKAVGTGDGGVVHGTAADEIFFGSQAINSLHLDYAHSASEFSIKGDDAAFVGPDGIDVLIDIKEAHFLGGTLFLGSDSSAAQVSRLYDAVLGRPGEADGLRFWIDKLETGSMKLVEAAEGFIKSEEFETRFGLDDTKSFLTNVYKNVLDRGPDSEGLSFWIEKMDGGMSKSDVILNFSESRENLQRFSGDHPSGIFIMNESAIEVSRLYNMALGRMPDGDGMQNWLKAVSAGMSYEDVAKRLMNSDEGHLLHDGTSTTQFVESLYHTSLGRDSDNIGLAMWVQKIDSGAMTALDAAWHIAHSEEGSAIIISHLSTESIIA